jgi:hypothetical protein
MVTTPSSLRGDAGALSLRPGFYPSRSRTHPSHLSVTARSRTATPEGHHAFKAQRNLAESDPFLGAASISCARETPIDPVIEHPWRCNALIRLGMPALTQTGRPATSKSRSGSREAAAEVAERHRGRRRGRDNWGKLPSRQPNPPGLGGSPLLARRTDIRRERAATSGLGDDGVRQELPQPFDLPLTHRDHSHEIHLGRELDLLPGANATNRAKA